MKQEGQKNSKASTAKSERRALPLTESWVPREKAANSLGNALAKRCASGEASLLKVLNEERDLVVDNFDSGLPFETAVREEIARLLPRRYDVAAGVLVDRRGYTAGQCDIVVFNSLWFTPVNAPTAAQPSRLLIPVEGAYAVGEVKQRLSESTLDAAMEKLVTCQRLDRPRSFSHRLVENREGAPCPHGLTNPLFTFIIAGDTDGPLEPLINRFFDINRSLKRLEVARCLCVLGKGTVTWWFRDPSRAGEIRPACFMGDDLFLPIVPAYSRSELRPPLFAMLQALQLHLFHSILAPEDIATAYGDTNANIRALPMSRDVELLPDAEWMALLSKPCSASERK